MNRTETALYPYGIGSRIAVIPHEKASSGKNAFPNRYRDFSELYFNRSGFCLLRFFPATNNADRLMYFKRFGVIIKSTFSVLFYLKRQAERNGKVPLTGRIAVDGTISQFCGQRPVSPELCPPQTTKRPTKVSRPGISTRHRNRHRQAAPAHWRPECVCDRRKGQERAVGVRGWLSTFILQTFDK